VYGISTLATRARLENVNPV